MPLVEYGLPHLPDDAVGKQSKLARICRLADHDELVAADARHEICIADIRLEDFRGVDEHRVAGCMPERVIDLLEAVEIDVQQRDLAAVAARACAVLCQGFIEIAAVRQAGQRVVKRVVLDARLGQLELGGS